jgi:hypothetical protein
MESTPETTKLGFELITKGPVMIITQTSINTSVDEGINTIQIECRLQKSSNKKRE